LGKSEKPKTTFQELETKIKKLLNYKDGKCLEELNRAEKSLIILESTLQDIILAKKKLDERGENILEELKEDYQKLINKKKLELEQEIKEITKIENQAILLHDY